MIHIHIPALGSHSSEYRRGDTQVIYDDNKKCIVIDGGRSELKDAMLKYLRNNGLTHVTVILTHAHYDHYSGVNGLLDAKGIYVDCIYMPNPADIKKGYPSGWQALEQIRKKAGRLGHPVYYPAVQAWTDVRVGEIWCRLWRKAYNAADDTNNETKVNNTSICAYFPDLQYMTTGDAIRRSGDFIGLIKASGYPVKWIKIPHHGNALNKADSATLKSMGCEFAWYNDVEPNGTIGKTGFTKTGAKNAAANFTTWSAINAIDAVCKDGMLTIVSGSKSKTITLKASESEQKPSNSEEKPVMVNYIDLSIKAPEIGLKSTGAAVMVWQAILLSSGIKVSIDGDFGKKTQAATIEYQTKNPACGTPDGIVGRMTWADGLARLEA